jgi:hypothetical protein
MNNLIGITGKIGAGKSLCADYLTSQYGYEEYCFATPLKQIASVFGFTHQQLWGTQEEKLLIHPYWKVSGRTFLQILGTNLFRQHFSSVFSAALPEWNMQNSIWIECFKRKYEAEKNLKKFVVSDVRFKDEAKAIKDLGGTLIRIYRPSSEDNKGQETLHISENEINEIEVDYEILNNSSKEHVFEMLQKIVTKSTQSEKN